MRDFPEPRNRCGHSPQDDPMTLFSSRILNRNPFDFRTLFFPMNRARLSSLELPPALFFVLFMALLTGLAVPPRVCAENSYPGWAYPNRVDCTSWPTFDEFHKMSVEEKQQVELAWMMKVYERSEMGKQLQVQLESLHVGE
jgi:hypothetical protein